MDAGAGAKAGAPATVRNGIDVLTAGDCALLRAQRVALVTNHSGLTLAGRRTIDVLYEHAGVNLARLFAPEHGLSGRHEEPLLDSVDGATGLPVHSLFGPGERYRPSAGQLSGIDAVVYDIADVGCRFYTYISTLGHVLEACAAAGVAVCVLDRPNPIGGVAVEGPCSDRQHESFVAFHPMPLRHGMTVGETARFFNVERAIGCTLRVIKMEGWQRGFWFADTGQRWVNPSPNIRDVVAAALFPGVGLLEGTNVSVGRGTLQPFQVFGAPWIDAKRLSAALYERKLPGLRYQAVNFVPDDPRHKFHAQTCRGVRFFVDDEKALPPCGLGLALIEILRGQHAQEWDYASIEPLLARGDLLAAIAQQSAQLRELWRPEPGFLEARERALLY